MAIQATMAILFVLAPQWFLSIPGTGMALFLSAVAAMIRYDPMQPLFSDWSHPLTVVVENPVPASGNMVEEAVARVSDFVLESAGSD